MTVQHIFYVYQGRSLLITLCWRYYLHFLQSYDIKQSWDTVQEKKITVCKCVVDSVSARHCKFTNWVNLLVTQHCKEVNTSWYDAQTLEMYHTWLCVRMAQIKFAFTRHFVRRYKRCRLLPLDTADYYDELLLPAELRSHWWSRSGLPLVTHHTDNRRESVVWDTCSVPT